MKCDNYEDDGKCRYFQALIGTDEDPPTGMDQDNGECLAIQEAGGEEAGGWIMVEEEDCDMLDLEDV